MVQVCKSLIQTVCLSVTLKKIYVYSCGVPYSSENAPMVIFSPLMSSKVLLSSSIVLLSPLRYKILAGIESFAFLF